jgi:hypothetical protein
MIVRIVRTIFYGACCIFHATAKWTHSEPPWEVCYPVPRRTQIMHGDCIPCTQCIPVHSYWSYLVPNLTQIIHCDCIPCTQFIPDHSFWSHLVPSLAQIILGDYTPCTQFIPDHPFMFIPCNQYNPDKTRLIYPSLRPYFWDQIG